MPDNVPVKQLLKLATVMLLVSFLGFVDATYLTVSRFQNTYVPCNLTHACDVVLTSNYSTIFGIPVVLLGAIYYLVIGLGAYAYLEYRSVKLFRLTAALTGFGFGFSIWFVYVQLGILHAICQYCMVSALTSTLLFSLGLWTLKTSFPFQLPIASDQE